MNARLMVSAVLFVLMVLMANVVAAQDEVAPGVPLDGSILIDETIWLRLVGEPGALMTEAHAAFLKKDYAASSAAMRKAASFLFIAEKNAFPRHQPILIDRAEELDQLAGRVAKGKVASREALESAFARAHYAMARHHAAKAADVAAAGQPLPAAEYMRSAAAHLERSAYWARRDLRTDTEQTIDQVRDSADELRAGTGELVEGTGELLEALGKRIERFGKSLKPPAKTEPPKPAKQAP